jgi:flagellar biosynthesis component FlhA
MSKMTEAMVVCGFVALVLAGIIVARLCTKERTKRGLSPTLIKLYGLLSVGGFALLLAVVEAAAEVKTAGYTLFGIIAGYLAGARVSSTGELAEDSKSDDSGSEKSGSSKSNPAQKGSSGSGSGQSVPPATNTKSGP